MVGAGSFGHHYCIFDAILYNSWQAAAILPAVRDKNKGCGDTCLFTVAAVAVANWEKHIQHRKKKRFSYLAGLFTSLHDRLI